MSAVYLVTAGCVLVAAGVEVLAWAAGRGARRAPDPDVFVLTVRVPQLHTADGQPITPCELALVSHLVAHEITRHANDLHAEVMARVVDQVAADETARTDLDAAAARLFGGTQDGAQ